MPVLRCEKLGKSFDGVQALRQIDLRIAERGITAVIGPNGSGKSTLLNVLTGFLRPDTGRCFLDDQELTHLPPHQIVQLGVARTFQDIRLIRHMSVLDNVMLARRLQRGERLVHSILGTGVRNDERINREKALDLLGLVGIASRADELSGTLSYGQQKLLSITCCLATEAKVLLLDEPVAGVHPDMASQILALLRTLCGDGKEIMFIEHDIGAVRQISDAVIVMDGGSIVAEGSAQEVLARPEIAGAYLA